MLVIAHTEIDTDAVCERAEHCMYFDEERKLLPSNNNTSHTEKNQENAAIYLGQSPKNISISSIILYKFLLLDEVRSAVVRCNEVYIDAVQYFPFEI